MRTTELHQRYFGLYVGTVLDPAGDPKNLGRVRVDLDQIEDTSDDKVWATVARPLAGKGHSAFFSPRERDQVIVGYLQGDPEHPVILGYAHSQERRPKDVSPTRHAIATPAGRITFDESGGGSIAIEVGGSRIEITNDGISISADKVCVNGQGVVLRKFIDRFDAHSHASDGKKPDPSIPPVTDMSTKC